MDQPQKPKRKRRLTPKEKSFVQEVLKPGASQTGAYLAVNPHVTRDSASVLGARVMDRPHVQEHINETLQRKYPDMNASAADAIMNCLNDLEASHAEKLNAVKLIMQLKGWAAPTKTQNLTAKIDMDKFKLPGSE